RDVICDGRLETRYDERNETSRRVAPWQISIKSERVPDIGVIRQEAESLGHHTYHFDSHVVQLDRFAENFLITSKFSLPEGITQDGRRWSAGPVILRRKYAPQHWPYSDQRKEFVRDRFRFQPFRFA